MSRVSMTVVSFPTRIGTRADTQAVGAIAGSGPSSCIQSPAALAQLARWYLLGLDHQTSQTSKGRPNRPPLYPLLYYVTTSTSELKAQTNGRIDRGSLKEAIGETIRHLRPHDTGIGVEALRKPVIRDERNRIQLSAALRQAGIRTMGRVQGSRCPALKTVLLFVVIGDA